MYTNRCENNTEGATPLHVAASHRCSAVVFSALVNDVRDNSAAAAAADSDPRTGTSLLLPLSLTNIGRSPLHHACLSFCGLDVEAF